MNQQAATPCKSKAQYQRPQGPSRRFRTPRPPHGRRHRPLVGGELRQQETGGGKTKARHPPPVRKPPSAARVSSRGSGNHRKPRRTQRTGAEPYYLPLRSRCLHPRGRHRLRSTRALPPAKTERTCGAGGGADLQVARSPVAGHRHPRAVCAHPDIRHSNSTLPDPGNLYVALMSCSRCNRGRFRPPGTAVPRPGNSSVPDSAPARRAARTRHCGYSSVSGQSSSRAPSSAVSREKRWSASPGSYPVSALMRSSR